LRRCRLLYARLSIGRTIYTPSVFVYYKEKFYF
jgi:hypothetical protein